MTVRKISDGDIVCAVHVTADDWKPGLNFFSEETDFIQVGTWGYKAGKELKAHEHNVVPRATDRTQEVLYVKRGRLSAVIYGCKRQMIGNVVVNQGDILIVLRGGHSFSILEDDTQVLEVKNGPYPGTERDRARFTTDTEGGGT